MTRVYSCSVARTLLPRAEMLDDCPGRLLHILGVSMSVQPVQQRRLSPFEDSPHDHSGGKQAEYLRPLQIPISILCGCSG